VTDGVFGPAAAEAGTDAPPAFLPARPITHESLISRETVAEVPLTGLFFSGGVDWLAVAASFQLAVAWFPMWQRVFNLLWPAIG